MIVEGHIYFKNAHLMSESAIHGATSVSKGSCQGRPTTSAEASAAVHCTSSNSNRTIQWVLFEALARGGKVGVTVYL